MSTWVYSMWKRKIIFTFANLPSWWISRTLKTAYTKFPTDWVTKVARLNHLLTIIKGFKSFLLHVLDHFRGNIILFCLKFVSQHPCQILPSWQFYSPIMISYIHLQWVYIFCVTCQTWWYSWAFFCNWC